jgi:hypothetical protein
MKPNLAFDYLAPITKIENDKKETFIEGTLISEGLSRNGNFYTFESLRTIAESAVSVPLFYGTTTGIDPKTGLRCRNLHDRSKSPVGRIIKTWFDKNARKVFFKAVVTSKEVARKVREGFGVSIGGIADAKQALDQAGKIITKISEVIVNHVQILNPFEPTGMKGTKVHRVVQESMTFRSHVNGKILTAEEITMIVFALSQRGEL